MYCPRWRQRVDLVAAHATAATAGNRSTEHHNGAGVDAPLATPTRPRRSADAAAAHNLSLAEHDKTPLMNTPFSWSEHGAPRRTELRVVTEAQAAQFDELGFCVIEDAFSGDQLAALVAEIDALEAKLATDGGISTADEITFCAHLVLRSELCRGFTASPIFAGLCHDLLAAEDARLYWDQSVYKKPAPEKIFPYHQDNGCAYLSGARRAIPPLHNTIRRYTFIEPQPYLTCWVALNDATPENGCPNVIPGVHRMGARLHDYDDHHNGWTVKGLATENSVCVPARAGSIVAFSSLTPHMTAANTTDGVRKAYICQYARDGVVSVGSKDGTKATRTTSAAANPDRQCLL